MPTVHLLDYVAGNIRSLVNAIEKLGYQVDWIRSPEDVSKAEVRSHPSCPCQSTCLLFSLMPLSPAHFTCRSQAPSRVEPYLG